MKNALEPREAVVGNAYRNDHQLPRGLLEALIAFEECEELRDPSRQALLHTSIWR